MRMPNLRYATLDDPGDGLLILHFDCSRNEIWDYKSEEGWMDVLEIHSGRFRLEIGALASTFETS